MEIDQTLWISCESEPIRSCADDKAIDANANIKRISNVLFVLKRRKIKEEKQGSDT